MLVDRSASEADFDYLGVTGGFLKAQKAIRVLSSKMWAVLQGVIRA